MILRGSPVGHQAPIRRACCRRLTAAQPNNVAAMSRPAGMALSRLSRPVVSWGLLPVRLGRDEGADKIAVAVSLAASI